VSGRNATTLAHGRFEPGQHRVEWNGCSDDGEGCPSGACFCELTVGGKDLSRKMTLLTQYHHKRQQTILNTLQNLRDLDELTRPLDLR
jgi:hypothetical protein